MDDRRLHPALHAALESWLLDGGVRVQGDLPPVTTRDLESLAVSGGSFDFLSDDAEDIYSLEDGA